MIFSILLHQGDLLHNDNQGDLLHQGTRPQTQVCQI